MIEWRAACIFAHIVQKQDRDHVHNSWIKVEATGIYGDIQIYIHSL